MVLWRGRQSSLGWPVDFFLPEPSETLKTLPPPSAAMAHCERPCWCSSTIQPRSNTFFFFAFAVRRSVVLHRLLRPKVLRFWSAGERPVPLKLVVYTKWMLIFFLWLPVHFQTLHTPFLTVQNASICVYSPAQLSGTHNTTRNFWCVFKKSNIGFASV